MQQPKKKATKEHEILMKQDVWGEGGVRCHNVITTECNKKCQKNLGGTTPTPGYLMSQSMNSV